MQSATILSGNNGLFTKQKLSKLIKARDLALEEAKKSPCVRRKYGAVLFYGENYILAHNNRVSRCCDNMCIRDVMNAQHGHNTDIGAEIHAEQSLLVKNHTPTNYQLLIVGINRDGNLLNGLECWPCYSCARIIKEAGIERVWVPEPDDKFTNYLIDGILEDYEQTILNSVGDF